MRSDSGQFCAEAQSSGELALASADMIHSRVPHDHLMFQ